MRRVLSGAVALRHSRLTLRAHTMTGFACIRADGEVWWFLPVPVQVAGRLMDDRHRRVFGG